MAGAEGLCAAFDDYFGTWVNAMTQEKIQLSQTVLVEGRYDKARLSGILDAHIITTDGFSIFSNKKKLEMLRTLAAKNGLVILTDSDRAGFRIRQYVGGAIPPAQITHVYIPDMAGKEKRKAHPGKEGKLGVEGIPNHVLREAFFKAGLFGEDALPTSVEPPLTGSDLFDLGLSGKEGSFEKRQALLKKLNLPQRLSTKALLQVLNRLHTKSELIQLIEEL